MSFQDMLSERMTKVKKFFSDPVKSALVSLSDIFESTTLMSDSKERVERSIIALFSLVMWADGKVLEDEVRIFRSFFSAKYSEEKIDEFLAIIYNKKEVDIDLAISILNKLSEDEKKAIVLSLIEVAVADNVYSEKQKDIIKKICQGFNFGPKLIIELEQQFLESRRRRENFLKSSAGIIAALVIIIIFILTATFLKSVLFGLILAYFCLPLQAWFQNRFFEWGPIKKLFSMFDSFTDKCSDTALRIKEFYAKNDEDTPAVFKSTLSPLEKAKLERESTVKRACNFTVVTVMLGILIIGIFVFTVSASYITGIGNKVKKWADQTVIEEQNKINTEGRSGAKDNIVRMKYETDDQGTDTSSQNSKKKLPDISGKVDSDNQNTDVNEDEKSKVYLKSLLSAWVRKVEMLKPKLQKVPGLLWIKDRATNYLKDEKNQEALASIILQRSGGFFSYTAGFLGDIFSLLFNLTLTVFFFTFFLQKIALSQIERKPNSSPGSYLVNVIFRSRWMPYTTVETRNEAREIIDNIFYKLKTWIRGYISIIILESIVYVIAFLVLDIPYAIPVGLVAGCTVLLPFIGPIASFMLTALVYVTFCTKASMVTLLILGLLYLFMNGIIEQLFLYPALIGNAIGLNTLETIIVVLLGGLFAGLPGMIFAIPSASVLKYLIPKIYRCWQ